MSCVRRQPTNVLPLASYLVQVDESKCRLIFFCVSLNTFVPPINCRFSSPLHVLLDPFVERETVI